jgi:hypothetical protein
MRRFASFLGIQPKEKVRTMWRIRQRPHKPTSHDLSDALAVTASFQNYVQHADGKVNILVVSHAGAAMIVATQAGASAKLSHVGLVMGFAFIGFFLLGFLMSGYHMFQAIRPILRPAAVRSRYGVVGIGSQMSVTLTEDIPTKITEAWAMTRLLAEIAERKYRHVAKALPWAGLMLVSAMSWAVLVAAWR